jgi:hypothetical protein
MVAAGKIEALPTGFTQTIPTREVDRPGEESLAMNRRSER